MKGWEESTLGELCKTQGGKIQTGPFGSQLHQSDYVDEGVPVVMPKDINQQGIDLSCIAQISSETAERLSRHKMYLDEIVFPRRGEITKCALIKREQEGFLCGTGCLKITVPTKALNPLFFRYYLAKKEIIEWLDSNAVGATMKNLSAGILQKLPVVYPSLPIQQKIAMVLSVYDNFIENNLKRIRLLEEMALITYEEWFVRRKINGNLIKDENIRYVTLKELIIEYKNGGWGKEKPEGQFTEEGYVIRGTDIPDILSGNFNSVPKRFHTKSNLEPRTLIAGDIIMEMSNGNIGNVGRSLYYDDSCNTILGNKVMCASFCKMARASNIEFSYLVDSHIKYIHKNNQMLIYKSQGANGINNFQFDQMIEEEIINIPENKETLDELTSHFNDVYKALSILRKQIHFLKEARNILLPRLMAGVINIESYDPVQILKEAA